MTRSAQPARVAGVVFACVLGALLLAAVAITAWVGVRGANAYTHLRAAQTAALDARADLSDPAAAAASIDRIAADTSAARALTSDPIWRLAEALPWVGPQMHAVSTVSASIDDVATSALPPLAEVAGALPIDSLRPVDGRFDLTVFARIAPAAAVGAEGIAAAAASVDDLDRSTLLAPVRDAVDEVSALLDETGAATGALARASLLLPTMLGAEGPRDYLVLFQNNAEWRSLGGIPGAMALMHVDGGAITLAEQAATSDFPTYPDPVLELGDDVSAVYGERPGRWIQNITMVPDFAVTGALAQEMWAREHDGRRVDGVLALDPVALSYLLTATGPVTLPTGDVITADNAVPLLLNEAYLRYEQPSDQDAFFAAASAGVFDALARGAAEPAALVAALTRAGEENRLLIWSAHEEDQQILAGTTLAGALPATDDETARFAVFLNDGTGSKMDFYATADTTIAWDSCTKDASGHASGVARSTVTITNRAPADAASLPRYVTGGGDYGVPPGSIETVAYLYLPEGFELMESAMSDGSGFGGGTHDGRRVLSFEVEVAPGQSVTATVVARSGSAGAPTLEFVSTPRIGTHEPVTATCG